MPMQALKNKAFRVSIQWNALVRKPLALGTLTVKMILLRWWGYFAMNTPFKEPFILAFVRAIRKPLAFKAVLYFRRSKLEAEIKISSCSRLLKYLGRSHQFWC